MKRYFLTIIALCACLCCFAQTRSERLLTQWEFRGDHDATATDGWTTVSIPHDWAISGPFDRSNDLQEVAIVQNGEETASVKTGRSGGLPYMGKGCYRRSLEISADELADGRRCILMFDGAMSEARVYVNGQEVCFWPYGYNTFYCDVTEAVTAGDNELYVLLENREQSSRWYPGAGLYRKVRLLNVPEIHVPVWGTYVTTPYVSEEYANVTVRTEVEGLEEKAVVTLQTTIYDMKGQEVASTTDTRLNVAGLAFEQQLTVPQPALWSPESPCLYVAETKILTGGSVETDWSGRHKITVTDGTELQDCVCTRFGIRTVEFRAGKGFFLNGEHRKIQGVCLHHDLGPLGAAVNKSAIRHQLTMLKDMGCDAIRTSHNMPAEELVDLCDEMGFMLMLEPFDEWDVAKCENGYHRFFDEWMEKDMVNMLRHYRNNASVIMWSIGNEVPSQWAEGGVELAARMQEICHRLDPTRLVTCGMDQFDAVVTNGFASTLDVPSFNYKSGRYLEAMALLPQELIIGSEASSVVSSRGSYHFPVTIAPDLLHSDHQSSSYDVEFCSWSNIPDDDFGADADYDWVVGQFVWTGFDYLGEPSPYDTDAWPNHSSMFGIIDLASIPKDRFYLYRSLWNPEAPTLHVLPHWNWEGREGETTPVFVYTSYPEAELFVNGKSQGRRSRVDDFYGARTGGVGDENAWNIMSRFRLMWRDVVYEPGELKVVAYNADGSVAEEKVVRTAGKAATLCAKADQWNSKPCCGGPDVEAGAPCCGGEGVAPRHGEDFGDPDFNAGKPCCPPCDGEELIYINVSVADKDGIPVPTDNREVSVSVTGGGTFKAIANGDPTSLEAFQTPKMHLFNGQLTVIVARTKPTCEPPAAGADAPAACPAPAPITVTVSAKGLKKAVLTLQ